MRSQALPDHKTENRFIKLWGGEFGQAGEKERGARQHRKRLLYCVNVNRTSLDHLLLGRNADVDKNVEWFDCNAGSGRGQNNHFLNLWVWVRQFRSVGRAISKPEQIAYCSAVAPQVLQIRRGVQRRLCQLIPIAGRVER